MSTETTTQEVSNVDKEEVVLDKPAKTVFPPPINWNATHAAASRSEMFAYLSNTVIMVAKVKDDTTKSIENMVQPTWPTFTMMGSQNANYTCISMCQQEYALLPIENSPVVTGDSIGFVKIWNIEDKAYPLYHTAHKPNTVMDVVWSTRDANLIYSIDSAGLVTIWNVRESTLKTINYDRPSMSCLAVSPYEDHIIAVGFLSGSILIVDTSTQSGEILCKMNHCCDLISIRWVPEEFWSAINLEAHHKTPLLISSVHTMEEPTIRVWDRQGNDVCILTLGEKKDEGPVSQNPVNRSVQRKQFKTFVSSAWIVDPITQELKLFSSFKNNVVYWKNLSAPFTVLHDIHRFGSIFCMVQTSDILWSFGSECMIVGYSLRLGERDVIVPTYKGICTIHMSPVLRSQLAFGGGDGILRVMNIHQSYPSVGPYEPPVLTGRIHEAKITAACWHPQRDNLIGLGTNEGVLGIYEYRDNNRHTKLCERRVNGTIYGLDWGPQCYTKEYEEKRQEKYGANTNSAESENVDNKEPAKSNLVLYACGGNRVHMINPMYTSATLVNVGMIIHHSNASADKQNRGSTYVTEIRWCPDRIFFCVGYSDGRIDIYTPPYLKLRCSIKCHTRDIQHLCWRPYDFGQYTDSLSKWLASSSNDGTIRLYNLADLYSKQAKGIIDETKFDLIRQSASTLNGHNGIRVIALAWSPHDPKLLVSVSYDRSAVIWNIIDGSRIARYCGHSQRLVSAMFHPSNKYQVLTCSDELINDFSMHVWDYRDYPYKEVPDGIITQVASRKQAIKVERIEKEQEPVRLGTFTSVQKGTIYKGEGPQPISEQETMPTITYVGGPQLTKEKPMLPLSSSFLEDEPAEGNKLQEQIESLIDYNIQQQKAKAESSGARKKKSGLNAKESSKSQTDNVPAGLDETVKDFAMYLGLTDAAAGKDESLEKSLRTEISNHISDGAWHNASHLSVWTGNHAEIVELALKKNEISQSIVELVLSNPYSAKFRAQVISAYAKKLEANNNIPLAAHYLLTIGHDEDAVDLYLRKHYYHEAFTLAKTRLRGPMRCELMKKIHTEWAADLVDQGKYLLAIRMYCATSELSKVLQVLELWNTAGAWKIGISVARTAEDWNAGDSFGMKYIEHALAHGQYDECLTIIQNFSFLNWLLPIVLMHQRLTLALKTSKEDDDTEADSKDGQIDEFAKSVLSEWGSRKVDYESSKDKILTLLKMVIPQNKEEALYVIARYMSLILLDDENSSKYWMSDIQPIAVTWFGRESSEFLCIDTSVQSLASASILFNSTLEDNLRVELEELVEENSPTFITG